MSEIIQPNQAISEIFEKIESRYDQLDVSGMRNCANCPELILEAAKVSYKEYQNELNGEPNEKITIDGHWIDRNSGRNRFNITSTDFEDLPVDWKYDNIDSLVVALIALQKLNENTELPGDHKKEVVAEAVHRAFISRRRAMGVAVPDNQILAYEELSDVEKEKDQKFYDKAQELLDKNPDLLKDID